jgi:DNA primase
MKQILAMICVCAISAPILLAGDGLEDNIRAHSAQVKERVRALKQSHQIDQRGVIQGDGCIRVNGKEAPELVAIEDMIPHFLTYCNAKPDTVLEDLENRGMKQEDRDLFTQWLDDSPSTTVNQRMAETVGKYKKNLKSKGIQHVTREQAEAFCFFQKEQYTEIVLSETISLFRKLSPSGQRALHSYLFERFVSLTRVHWIRIPETEKTFYQTFLFSKQ